MKNLLIGGAGFIGRNLLEILESDNTQNSIVLDSFRNSSQESFEKDFPLVKLNVFDAANETKLKKLIEETKPDRIFHLAANSDIRLSSANPTIDMQDTFLTTLSLINSIDGFKPDIFFASSSAIYGEKENNIKEDENKTPASPYGWMKWTSEEILLQAKKQGKIENLIIFRFPNVVGKYMTHGVIFDLLNKLQVENDKLEVLGDGYQKKPYVLANELCEIILRAMSSKAETQVLNISNGSQILVKDIVQIICDITTLSPVVEYSSTRSGWVGDVPEYQLDCSKAENTLGNLDFTDSKNAIIEAVKIHTSRHPFV